MPTGTSRPSNAGSTSKTNAGNRGGSRSRQGVSRNSGNNSNSRSRQQAGASSNSGPNPALRVIGPDGRDMTPKPLVKPQSETKESPPPPPIAKERPAIQPSLVNPSPKARMGTGEPDTPSQLKHHGSVHNIGGFHRKSDEPYIPPGMTREDLDKPVTFKLTESPTVMLLDIAGGLPPSALPHLFPSHARVGLLV